MDEKIIFIFFSFNAPPPLSIHYYVFISVYIDSMEKQSPFSLALNLSTYSTHSLCTELLDCYSVQNAVTDNIYLVHIDNGIVHSDLLIIAAEYIVYPAILWSVCHWFHINVILYANFNTKNRVFSNMHIKEK